jgi:hypothetical protein
VVLSYAHLQSATLKGAQFQGTLISNAQFQGASLDGAQLLGAEFAFAQLEGASLEGAQLQGATLQSAHLEGASLRGAHLEGANLSAAHLDGATLEMAQLQGADIRAAQLDGASLDETFLWRTMLGYVEGQAFSAIVPNWSPEFVDVGGVQLEPQPWTQATYDALRQKINSLVPEMERSAALKRIAILDCHPADDTVASCDSSSEPVNFEDVVYSKALAAALGKLICSIESDRLPVLRGLLRSRRVSLTLSEAPALIARFSRDDCPVSKALTDADKACMAAQAAPFTKGNMLTYESNINTTCSYLNAVQ